MTPRARAVRGAVRVAFWGGLIAATWFVLYGMADAAMSRAGF